jgi:hypothetical protein
LAAKRDQWEGGEAADGAENGLKEIECESGECGDTAIGAKSLVKQRAKPDDASDGNHFIEDVDAEKPRASGDVKESGSGVAGDDETHIENEATGERGKELEEEGETEDTRAGLRCIHAGTVFLRVARRC